MKIKGRNKITPEFNMSSMTDIVFLLLIFFMIASTLVTTSAINIVLPKANGKAQNQTKVTISIKEDLTYYINQKRVGLSILEAELKKILSVETIPTIVLRAEKSVPVDYVVKVMDIANRNNFKVVLAVKPQM